MRGSFPLVTVPPPPPHPQAYPCGFDIFSCSAAYSSPQAGNRRQFPPLGTPIYLNNVCRCTSKGCSIGRSTIAKYWSSCSAIRPSFKIIMSMRLHNSFKYYQLKIYRIFVTVTVSFLVPFLINTVFKFCFEHSVVSQKRIIVLSRSRVSALP